MRYIIAASTIVLFSAGAQADVNVSTQDLNGDGTVTFEEFIDSHDSSIAHTDAFLARHRQVFDGADTNSDGVVDAGESQGGTTGKQKRGGKKDKS
jgi:Ca2+-binding EF-hand superfamily protein